MQESPWSEESLGNCYSYFSHRMSAFLLLDSHPMVYFIILEMNVFSYEFYRAREKTAKRIIWAKPEMICRADDSNFLYKLLLIDRQIANIYKAFANNSAINVK